MALDFRTLNQAEERILAARLEAIRASISHAGEKGRALETAVGDFLRHLLPPEYGVGSGFVAWLPYEGAAPQLSSQLDVIIYDAHRCSPLIRLGSCDVFPLESVFGYVEVKASMRSSAGTASPPGDSIEACVAKNFELRKMKRRVFWSGFAGSPAQTVLSDHDDWLSIRSYVLAFEAAGAISNVEEFAARLRQALQATGSPAHIHGVFIPGSCLLWTKAVDRRIASTEDLFQIGYSTNNSLLRFKAMLLHHLASFDRPPGDWTPAYDQYLLDHLDSAMQESND